MFKSTTSTISSSSTSSSLESEKFQEFKTNKLNKIHSLNIITDEITSRDNLGCSGLSFFCDDFLPATPDTLHTNEKPYPRRGISRYIIETDLNYTIYSYRGWLNLGFVVFLIFTMMYVFAIWPIYQYLARVGTTNPTDEWSRQSGPFQSSDLP
ncbi:hypothetical protein DFH28DRAFT_417205 [Melampsora americana]|nr:hypothetical protein DFH28DRAFT_417205 [Melampsora americana]